MDRRSQKTFNEIKKLLISPPILKAPTPDGLFQLKSDTLQKQGDEWVVIGYHSKGLPKLAKNFGITELELTGLLVNIHGFMQLLRKRYFEVLVDHKLIEYMIKSKTESPTTRLKTLLLKLQIYYRPKISKRIRNANKQCFKHITQFYRYTRPEIHYTFKFPTTFHTTLHRTFILSFS